MRGEGGEAGPKLRPMSFDALQILGERFTAAIARAFPEVPNPDPMIAAGKNPAFGDFQSNAAMALAKTVGKPPREAAKAIVSALDLGDLAEPVTEASIAGPGFINIRLRPAALARLLGALDTPGLGIEPVQGDERVVVDLCGVNLAKQMHVGHLRATVIGDCLARVLSRLGYKVKRQNHVGDWGLPIAMVVARLMEMQAQGQDIRALNLDQIERVYRSAQKDSDADERGLAFARKWHLGPKVIAELEEQVGGASEAMARAKQTLLRLQAHDPAVAAVWQRIVDVTMGECLKACARLNTLVSAEDSAGESSYAQELAPLVADLETRKVTQVSDGALVIKVDGIEEPCLVRKSDGGFLYATTDLAAIRRRVQTFGARRVVYCVDARQSLHFRQVFGAAHLAGYTKLPDGTQARLEHAAFGTVLGEDGKPFKTRSGENVKLSDLIDEAIARAAAAVAEKNPDLSPVERQAVAEAVGVAAIKYADLSSDRVKDYVFSFDRMLALEGNTGPYLLYALVRMRSIARKAVERGLVMDPKAELVIEAKEEKGLALTLMKYPGVVKATAGALEPHRLCGYLFELAGAFSVFFTNCPVLAAEDARVRASRLRLCTISERVLADGLTLLGIRLLDRM